jgi:hypothetical protein
VGYLGPQARHLTETVFLKHAQNTFLIIKISCSYIGTLIVWLWIRNNKYEYYRFEKIFVCCLGHRVKCILQMTMNLSRVYNGLVVGPGFTCCTSDHYTDLVHTDIFVTPRKPIQSRVVRWQGTFHNCWGYWPETLYIRTPRWNDCTNQISVRSVSWLGHPGARLHKQSLQCTQYAHFNDCTNGRYNPCLTNRWNCTMIDQSVIAIGPYPGKNMRYFKSKV